MIVMSFFAMMSIHARSLRTPSALTSPLFGRMLLITTLLPHTSTHAVYTGGDGCAPGSLHRFGGLTGGACPPDPSAIDCTIPLICTSQPSRCTRSAPGSRPSLLTSPSGVITSRHPDFSVIGPPPRGWPAPMPPMPPNDRTVPSTSISLPAVMKISPPDPCRALASTFVPGSIVNTPIAGKLPTVIVISPARPPPPLVRLLEIWAPTVPSGPIAGAQTGNTLAGLHSVMSPSTVISMSPPLPPFTRFSAKMALPAFMTMFPCTRILIGHASLPGAPSSLQRMLPPFSITRSPGTVHVPATGAGTRLANSVAAEIVTPTAPAGVAAPSPTSSRPSAIPPPPRPLPASLPPIHVALSFVHVVSPSIVQSSEYQNRPLQCADSVHVFLNLLLIAARHPSCDRAV